MSSPVSARSVPAPAAPPRRMPSPYGPYESTSMRAAHLVRLFHGEQQRHELIAQAAYFRARHRGFAPGHELEDWLAAEAEIDAALALGMPLQTAP
jgi:Protein of unknown function (DUF2934)